MRETAAAPAADLPQGPAAPMPGAHASFAGCCAARAGPARKHVACKAVKLKQAHGSAFAAGTAQLDTQGLLGPRRRRLGAGHAVCCSRPLRAHLKVDMAAVAAPPPLAPAALMRPWREDRAFTDPLWEFSFARRGHRVLATLALDRCTLRTVRGCDVSAGLPALVVALAGLRSAGTVLDAQVSVLEGPGTGSAGPLHMRSGPALGPAEPLVCWLQDIVAFEGTDVRGLPWCQRRELLRRLPLAPPEGPLRLMQTVPALGSWLFDQALLLGHPGIHAHRRQAPYHDGLSADWLLIPCAG